MSEEYVIRVLSADTFETRESAKLVHLANVEAPEVRSPRGIVAEKHLRGLIERETVLIEIVGKDESGREVANVWRDKLFINGVMNRYIPAIGRPGRYR